MCRLPKATLASREGGTAEGSQSSARKKAAPEGAAVQPRSEACALFNQSRRSAQPPQGGMPIALVKASIRLPNSVGSGRTIGQSNPIRSVCDTKPHFRHRNGQSPSNSHLSAIDRIQVVIVQPAKPVFAVHEIVADGPFPATNVRVFRAQPT